MSLSGVKKRDAVLRDELSEKEFLALWPANRNLNEAVDSIESKASRVGKAGHELLGVRTSVRNHLLWMAERQFSIDHTKLSENHIMSLLESCRLTIDYNRLMKCIG